MAERELAGEAAEDVPALREVGEQEDQHEHVDERRAAQSAGHDRGHDAAAGEERQREEEDRQRGDARPTQACLPSAPAGAGAGSPGTPRTSPSASSKAKAGGTRPG